ncbi:MAG: FAD-dependent oxidoreductase, partial [Bacteroidota bacterium]
MKSKRDLLHYDTVVVGAGVSGMYTALRLAEAKQTVGLFEMSDRFGGRVETVLMGGKNAQNKQRFKAEFGPMRFEEKGQVRLKELVEELELSYSPFPAYQSSIAKWPKYDLTKEEADLDNPLHILLMGILKLLGKHRPGMKYEDMQDVVGSFDEEAYKSLRKEASYQGEPLYKQGFWNALSDVLSHQAILKIRDTGNFYHLIPDNPNAIEWIIFWLRGLQPNDQLVGIKGGSKMLSEGLWRKLNEIEGPGRVKKHLNHKLIGLKAEGEQVFLEFELANDSIQKVVAKNVILALPKSPLMKLAQFFPEKIRKQIDSVIAFPLLKCFFVTKNPWWDEDTKPQTGAGTMPTRELHFYQEHVRQLEEENRNEYLEELKREKPGQLLRTAFEELGIHLPADTEIIQKTMFKEEREEEGKKSCLIRSQSEPKRFNYFIRFEDLSIFDKNGAGMVMVYS